MKTPMLSGTRENLSPMTDEERQQLQKLATLQDDQIDTTDIPEVTAEQAKSAVRGWQNHPGRARNRHHHAA